MGDQSAIEWTEATWNPIRGCSRVSEGCRNCYAERTAIRHEYVGSAQSREARKPGPYYGLVKSTPSGPRWTGEVRFAEEMLDLPLRWKKPRRIFVNSMSDLFHEKVPSEWIDAIFNVMAQAPQHTFQVLTKRPGKMRDYMKFWLRCQDGNESPPGTVKPLPNVWLGVSVEDQATADVRIPLLLQTPAAVRWVSYEPALGPVDFGPAFGYDPARDRLMADRASIAWVVVGGESGPGARPFHLAWARSTIDQCRVAGVPVFVKQLGAQPFYKIPEGTAGLGLRDRKGGDPAAWPEDLRVREYPK